MIKVFIGSNLNVKPFNNINIEINCNIILGVIGRLIRSSRKEIVATINNDAITYSTVTVLFI